MRAILRIIEDIADTDAMVLIRGESGVGKDVVARAIHAESARSDGPFVRINCAAIPSELLESEPLRSRERRLHGCTSTQGGAVRARE